MLTIFTVPKPFEGHIALIQENAIASWSRLHPNVEILLLGDETGVETAADHLGARYLSGVQTNELGTPLVSSVFGLAREAARHRVIAYVNTDVLLMPDVLSALDSVWQRFERFLIVGQRWDLAVHKQIAFTNGWEAHLRGELTHKGVLHPPAGSDYFIFPKASYAHVPPFAIGRAGWDNWMIYAARMAGTPVVDATSQITAVHQDHGYEHLPDGQPHYRLPESNRNLRLAGGTHTVFTLADATWEFVEGKLQRSRARWGRALEAEILARLGSTTAGAAAYALFHPLRTISRARGAFRGLLGSEESGESGQL